MSTSNQPSQTLPAAPPNSPTAIASVILGILGWTLLPGLGGLIAIVTGHMANAGLVLGYLSMALGLCMCTIISLPPHCGGIMATGFWRSCHNPGQSQSMKRRAKS